MLRLLLAAGLSLGLLAFIASPRAVAAERIRSENQKIEAMISHVEGLKQAKFVRNGVEYDSQIAAKFLRYVWNANQSKVRTADDFIRVVATASGAGIPYLVRFQDGRESKSRDYLIALLKDLERPPSK